MRPSITAWAVTMAILSAVNWACGSDPGPEIVVDAVGADGNMDAVAVDASFDAQPAGDVLDAGEPDVPVPKVDPVLAASLQALLDEHIAFTTDPGVTLAVFTADGASWAGASGVASLQEGEPMEPDAGFRVGSNTKPFVAVVVLQLVEEGLLGLDDPFTKYLPQYQEWNKVTVRHLLSMQSGIPDYLTNPQLMLDFVADPRTPRGPDVILSYVMDEDPLYEPGQGGTYSNSNYLLLGMIVEELTGRRIEDEIDRRIVEPLGLEHTFLDVTGDQYDFLANGYMDLALEAGLLGVPSSIVALLPADSVYQGNIVDTTYLFHPSLTWAAGALVSTAPDMARFMRALISGELLEPATLDEMKKTSETVILQSPVQYGLGLQVRDTAFGAEYGHGGLNFGYQGSTFFVSGLDVTFSHMHDYLPEQSWGLETELLELLSDPPPEPLVPCLPPGGFFHGYDGGVYVNVRFKGPVNEADQEAPVPGVAHVVWEDEDGALPLYGWGTQAQLKTEAMQTRLEVVSMSPSGDDDPKRFKITTVSLEPGLFLVLDDSGGYDLNPLNPGAAIVIVADVDLDDLGRPEKACFVAVNDPGRASRVEICDPDGFELEPGRNLKLFGTFAMETDPVAVKDALGKMGIATCLCMEADGTWKPCG